MKQNGYIYPVTGFTVGLVNPQTQSVKVRIPQIHGVEGTESYFVKNKDLPEAQIIYSLGTRRELFSLEAGTIVYLQFSNGELAYPLIIGWAGGNIYLNEKSHIVTEDNTFPVGSSPSTGDFYESLPGTAGEPTEQGFIIPCDYVSVTAGFGFYPNSSVVHHGTDLGAVGGTPIFSVKDSIIENIWYASRNYYTSWEWTVGNSIRARTTDSDGDPVYVWYMHMDHFEKDWSIGDSIPQGTVIGYVGNTGNSFGNHLHLGFYYMEGKNGSHYYEYRNPGVVMGLSDGYWSSPYEWSSQIPG